jgi:hypothetical protein
MADQAIEHLREAVLHNRLWCYPKKPCEPCRVCHQSRIQRNHINCAMLVWLRLRQIAYSTGQSVYQLKHGLLSINLIQQLKRPALTMTLA